MNQNEPAVSVVVPVRNEAGNIAPLVKEIAAALGARTFEVVYVNDGSTDVTDAELKELMAQYPWLRRVRHRQSCGQSAAVRAAQSLSRSTAMGRTIRALSLSFCVRWNRAGRASV